MFYSQSTGGFYSREIHGKNIPSDAVEITDAAYSLLMLAQIDGKNIRSDDAGYPVAVMPAPDVVTKDDLAVSIDDAVAAIYARYNRFQAEYTEREAQARDYKAAGYAGEIPQQVAAFATPANKTGKQAADIILAQAAQLRGALSQLGVLRMRKYEVLMCTSVTDAQTKAATILAAVQQIVGAL